MSQEMARAHYAINRANDDLNRQRGSLAAEHAARERQEYQERQAQVEARNERIIREREAARQDEIAREVKARREAERNAAEAVLREQLRAAYLGNPAATERDFEQAYPRLRQEHLEREALGQGSRFDRELAIARERMRNL